MRQNPKVLAAGIDFGARIGDADFELLLAFVDVGASTGGNGTVDDSDREILLVEYL